MKNLEIEYKWQAQTPRAFSRARRVLTKLCGSVRFEKLNIQDVYLDHAEADLSAQKIALRVRNTDGKWEATFKTRTQLKNGKATRQEATLPLPNVKNIKQALQILAQKKKWKGICLIGVEPVFKIKNKRTVCLFKYDGTCLEMALDNVTIYALRHSLKMKEIELELKRGKQEALDKFATIFSQQTQLLQAKNSKVKTAEKFLSALKNKKCQIKK